MRFDEAYKEMLAGKKIKRPGFKGYWFINIETGTPTIHIAGTNKQDKGKDIIYGKLDVTIKNCAATDWEILKEKEEEKKRHGKQ